jgi:tetratricopeptide (TPR) repeat protein
MEFGYNGENVLYGNQEYLMIRHLALVCAVLLWFLSSAGHAYDETYEKAVSYFKGREYRDAIPYLEKYVSRKPDPAGYYMLGYAFYQLRDYERSRAYFDEAYLIDPDFSSDKVPAHAGLSDEEERLIHDALALSGTTKQMAYYVDIVVSSVPDVQGVMSKERTTQDLRAIIRDSFGQSRLYPSLVSSFSNQFNRTHIGTVIQWLKSPLGRKMATLEIGTTPAEKIPPSVAFDDMYEKLPELRRLIIKEMEKTFGVTDLNIGIVSLSLYEMLKGMQSQLAERSFMSSSEIDALIENVRSMPREHMTRHILNSLSYRYRDVTDEEIRAAMQFSVTPAGRWFHETSRDALRGAIGKASRETGEKIGRTLVLKRLIV